MGVFRINDIFYSLQGEGRNTGRAAVFIRFAGCNLRCPFCDTEFDTYCEMSADEILAEIAAILPSHLSQQPPLAEDCRGTHLPLVVLTGGEPTLQVDEAFVDLLHQHGYEVAMESNGTRPAPKNLDWLTVSPKENVGSGQWYKGTRIPDEIKIIFDENTDLSPQKSILSPLTIPEQSSPTRSLSYPSPLLYLQPCDTGDPVRNAEITKACVAYIKEHPEWRLSLQTHKLIGID